MTNPLIQSKARSITHDTCHFVCLKTTGKKLKKNSLGRHKPQQQAKHADHYSDLLQT